MLLFNLLNSTFRLKVVNLWRGRVMAMKAGLYLVVQQFEGCLPTWRSLGLVWQLTYHQMLLFIFC